MSIKKSIGWCDMTLNPIKGRCKGGCWYCYYSGERGMLKRFKLNPEISLDLSIFDNLPKKPKKIFLCSTHDLFGGWIHPQWRNEIFVYIENYPQHTFQILTKFPDDIYREMPDNVWLGRTFTFLGDYGEKDIELFKGIKARVKFLSIEPMMAGILSRDLDFTGLDWIICGRLTGYKRENDPLLNWIEWLVEAAERDKCKIFLKDNLKEIWGENLIQEFPK